MTAPATGYRFPRSIQGRGQPSGCPQLRKQVPGLGSTWSERAERLRFSVASGLPALEEPLPYAARSVAQTARKWCKETRTSAASAAIGSIARDTGRHSYRG